MGFRIAVCIICAAFVGGVGEGGVFQKKIWGFQMVFFGTQKKNGSDFACACVCVHVMDWYYIFFFYSPHPFSRAFDLPW